MRGLVAMESRILTIEHDKGIDEYGAKLNGVELPNVSNIKIESKSGDVVTVTIELIAEIHEDKGVIIKQFPSG